MIYPKNLPCASSTKLPRSIFKTVDDAEYKSGKNNFEFKYFDKAQKRKFSYNGELNFRPFHSYLKGTANEIDFSEGLRSQREW